MSNDPDLLVVACEVCRGTGEEAVDDSYELVYEDCWECGGTGEIALGDTAAFL